MHTLSRRSFLKSSTVIAAPWIVPASVFGRDGKAPSERIRVGMIGLGSRGFNLLDGFSSQKDVQIAVVCDVHDLHYRDRPWGTGKQYGVKAAAAQLEKQGREAPSQTANYLEVCQRDDLDAVVVATPDHWHAHCTIAAIKAGKDVYCEKPVTHLFHEGQQVCRTVAEHQAVFQTGSQQRSDREFQQAVNLVRNGVLGAIKSIEVGLPPGYPEPQDSTEVQAIPNGLDYNLWCGPSPMLPYMRARHHRWWRGHRAYGGGVLMDWIGHHNDIAHWSMDLDRSGPVRVSAVDWTFPETDVYNTPFQYSIRSELPGGTVSTISSQNRLGTKWIGEDGWVFVTRGKIEASDKRWLDKDFKPGAVDVRSSVSHVRDFLDCMRTRKTCIAPAETTHRSITPGHLGYVSWQLQRPLNWDAENEVVRDDAEANTLLQKHDYRSFS